MGLPYPGGLRAAAPRSLLIAKSRDRGERAYPESLHSPREVSTPLETAKHMGGESLPSTMDHRGAVGRQSAPDEDGQTAAPPLRADRHLVRSRDINGPTGRNQQQGSRSFSARHTAFATRSSSSSRSYFYTRRSADSSAPNPPRSERASLFQVFSTFQS